MKLSTYAVALGPAILLFGLKTFVEPQWLSDWSFFDLLILGAFVGIPGGFAALIIEPKT